MALPRNDKAPLFTEAASSTLRLVLYLSMAIVLMVADRHNQYLQQIRQLSAVIVEPFYRLAAWPAELMQAVQLAFSERRSLSEENTRLHEQVILLQTRLNRLNALYEQNQRLKELLDVQHRLNLGVQLAKLLDIDLDPFRHRIVLDAGRIQGISVGQPVIDANGVVGQVVEVLDRTAIAMLITDPSHALPVKIERNGLRTIARGGGAIDKLELPNIPISADVKPGDVLVTSGLGGRFPAGFPVGVIRSVSNDASGMFTEAIATPSAALDRSGEVLLLHELAEPVGPSREMQNQISPGLEGNNDKPAEKKAQL